MVVANTVQMAVFRSVYLQTNAVLQMQAMALNPNVTYLTDQEAAKVEKDVWGTGTTYLRAWDLWKQKAMGN